MCPVWNCRQVEELAALAYVTTAPWDQYQRSPCTTDAVALRPRSCKQTSFKSWSKGFSNLFPTSEYFRDIKVFNPPGHFAGFLLTLKSYYLKIF